MKLFVTGVTGYLGGSIAVGLSRKGHSITGLVREAPSADAVAKLGIAPVVGSLDDHDLLASAARELDGVINAASSDHVGSIHAFVDGLKGSGKPFLHNSGSSIISDDARGEFESADIFEDDTPVSPIPTRKDRVEVDRIVRRAGIDHGVRAAVICPSMVYGEGLGLQPDSDQIPKLRKASAAAGAGLYIGKGANRWSNVHLQDLIDLYELALEKAPTASFFFAENGEETLKGVAEAVSRSLGFGGKTQSWNIDDAMEKYGIWAKFALGSNSRVRGTNARRLLGWSPAGPSLARAIGG